MTVNCYTNEKEVELFLNGVSFGRKTLSNADGCRAVWEIPYAPGTLRAVTASAEDRLSGGLSVGKSIAMKPESAVLKADGESVCRIDLSIVDEKGALAPADDERIRIQLLGDGELLGLENGKPDDLTPYSEDSRATLNGRLTAYVRAGNHKGTLTVHAMSADGSMQAQVEMALS